MSVASSPKKGPLTLNDSPIEQSIIAQMPLNGQSPDLLDKLHTLVGQNDRLFTQLNFYKQELARQDKNPLIQSKQSSRDGTKNSMHPEQHMKINQLSNEVSKLTQQNYEQNNIIHKLSQDLRKQKSQSNYGSEDLMVQCEKLQLQNDRFRDENIRQTREISELHSQLNDLQLTNKRNHDIIDIQKQQLAMRGRDSGEEGRLRQLEMQFKITQLNQELSENLQEIDNLHDEIDKLKKQNVIDRESRNRRTFDNLRVGQGSRSKYSMISHSRVSDFDAIDHERLGMKLSQRNKEYEMLYAKYQSLQNEYSSLQDLNQELQREQKMLEQRISSFQIHTEGDEMVGELQNKLVLMSTEVMRLGNLSRSKVQETKDLNSKIRQLILRNQHLQKDVIERDKTIVNYRQELRLLEIRLNNVAVSQSRSRDDRDSKDKTAKLMKEIQKVTNLYKQKIESLKNADIKNAILQEKNSRLQGQNQELERQNKSLSTNTVKYKDDVTRMMNQEAEINYYKESSQTLKDQIKRMEFKVYEMRTQTEYIVKERDQWKNNQENLQERFTSMQEDMRRINLKYDEKQMELRQLSHKAEERLIGKNNQVKRLEEKLMTVEKQNHRNSRYRSQLPKIEELLRQIQKLQASQLTLKLQISDYEERVVLLAQQNERLTLVADSRGNERGALNKIKIQMQIRDKKIRQLTRDVQTLSLREKRCKEDSEELRNKMRENIVEERKLQSWQFKNRQLQDELQAIKTQLSVREEEIRSINDRYHRQFAEKNSLLRVNQDLNSKISINKSLIEPDSQSREYFERQLRSYIDQSQRDSGKIKELQKRTQQHQDIYSTFSAQIMRLNQVLGEAIEKNKLNKKQIDFLKHKVQTCEQSLQSRRVPQISSQKSVSESQSKTKIQFFQGKIKGFEGETEMLKQRNNNMRQTNKNLQSKVNSLISQKSMLEMRINQLEYQISLKTQNFRDVEDSFKLTILQIKNSNQRLEKSLRQIEHHYITKLQFREQQCDKLKREKRTIEEEIHSFEKKVSNMEIQYGSQIKQKDQFINTLNSTHHQTKQQFELARQIKSQYQVKIALLSQQISRLESLKDKQGSQVEDLRRELKTNESRYLESMKDSSYNSRTIQTLSDEIQRLNKVLLQNVDKIKRHQKKQHLLQSQLQHLKQRCQEYSLSVRQFQTQIHNDKGTSGQQVRLLEKEINQFQYKLQQKVLECQNWQRQVKVIEERSQNETSSYMKSLLDELKKLRQTHQNLQNNNKSLHQKLSWMTKEYETLVQQLEYQRKSKNTSQQDQKMRILSNYQETIKSLKEENNKISSEHKSVSYELQRTMQSLTQMQERKNLAEETSRTFQQKTKRYEERLRVLEERVRNNDDTVKIRGSQKTVVEQKLVNVMEQVGRLQLIIKSKDNDLQQLNYRISQQENVYYSQEKMNDNRGIFVIRQASETEERSRSASGNNLQPQARGPVNVAFSDLQHRYELLESSNKKLTMECQCLRKKCIEYQFKMNKLKQQFDLINRLIHEYREQNDKLKQSNKLLNIQLNQRGNNLLTVHSQYSSPQHNSTKNHSYFQSHKHVSSISINQKSRQVGES